MNSEDGAVHQKRTTKDPINFVRENALVKEVDGSHVVTSKGEQFLQELKAAAGESSPDFVGVLQ
jgi:hypothetical protein